MTLAKQGVALRALLALTPKERGLVLCWFCDACHEYVGPGGNHRCTEGSAVWPAAEDAQPPSSESTTKEQQQP